MPNHNNRACHEGYATRRKCWIMLLRHKDQVDVLVRHCPIRRHRCYLPSLVFMLWHIVIVGSSFNEVAGGKPTGGILDMEILPATLRSFASRNLPLPALWKLSCIVYVPGLSHTSVWLMLITIYRHSIPAYVYMCPSSLSVSLLQMWLIYMCHI